MIDLQSAATYTVSGQQGFAFEGIPGFDPRTLLFQDVRIDGRVRHVLGVEVYGVPDATGRKFGLLAQLRAQPTGVVQSALARGGVDRTRTGSTG